LTAHRKERRIDDRYPFGITVAGRPLHGAGNRTGRRNHTGGAKGATLLTWMCGLLSSSPHLHRSQFDDGSPTVVSLISSDAAGSAHLFVSTRLPLSIWVFERYRDKLTIIGQNSLVPARDEFDRVRFLQSFGSRSGRRL